MADEWAARALSFGEVAERYDRVRPGYPDALYAELLDGVSAAGPPPRVLEAGAGTGRATLELARRGAHVHAVEPDPAMAAVARERTAGLPVEVEVARFEDHHPSPGATDLVVAAQAWHWVEPVAGAAVAARALGATGTLALWWNRPDHHGNDDDPVWAAVHDVYARLAPDLDRRNPTHSHAHREGDPDALPGFEPFTRSRHRWSAEYTADGYVDLLGTHSDHLRLDDDARRELLDAVHAAITAAGGRLEYRYRTVLLQARRAPGTVDR